MSIATFGLRDGSPSPEDINAQLDANDTMLLDVAQQIVNSINDQINNNAIMLRQVEQRIVNSINGHIRRNVSLLKPVGEAIFNAVHNAIDENQALINVACSSPAMQAYLAENPPPAEWASVVPSPDQLAALAPGEPRRIAGAPPPGGIAGPPPAGEPCTDTRPVCGKEGMYAVMFNCKTMQLAAVPNLRICDLHQLTSEGWLLAQADPCHLFLNDAQALAYLRQIAPQYTVLCASPGPEAAPTP